MRFLSRAAAPLLLAALACLFLPGCYEKVVSARGLGASKYGPTERKPSHYRVVDKDDPDPRPRPEDRRPSAW